MVKSDGFYLHEDWQGDLRTVTLHRGDCSHCNNGKGEVAEAYRSTPGKWQGPFKTQKQAGLASGALPDVNVRATCHCIKENTHPALPENS
jgi:hypothetical protein